MKKRELRFLLFLFIPLFSFAQINSETKRANHWYFGLGAGLDFSNGDPIADTSGKTNTFEGASSISDIYGGLLFYSDGNTIWNRYHVPMQGGYNLMGCDPNLVPINVSQNALIIPQPGNDSLYYLFHLGCTDFTLYTLQYTIVNMKLNNGLGGVISANNTLPTIATAQGLTACRHSDGCSIWLVAVDTASFYNFYKIDASGISTPILEYSQLYLKPAQGSTANYKFSTDLKMLGNITYTGFSNDTLMIHQFDNNTAQISNTIKISTGNQEIADICFSPDNKKLYAVGDVDINGKGRVLQYDLTYYQYDSIVNSKEVLYFNKVLFGHIQNGPDGKIYISRATLFPIYGNADSLSVINNPNLKGLACGFNLNGKYLGGKQNAASLPNFDQGYFYPLLNNPCINGIEYLNNETIQIFPTVFNSDFTIKNSAADNFTIKIRDVTGKVCYDSELNPYQTKIISMKNTSDGMYFLSLNNGQQVINYKLIKMNI